MKRAVASVLLSIANCNAQMLRFEMFKFESSLQDKVRYGYYICLTLIIIVAIVNYIDLKRIEKKISFSFVITELFDTTLEMRRFEKNFFLYKDKADYFRNLQYTEEALNIIIRNKESSKELSIVTDVYELEKEILKYKILMNQYFDMNWHLDLPEITASEIEIRTSGKKIIEIAEKISVFEKKYIQSLIVTSNRILIGSIIFVVLAGIIIAQYLSLMVVRPLKQLENSLRDIAGGKFTVISSDSSDREIVSLSKAFSTMINELESRQMKMIIQSEKLISLGTMASGIAHQLNNPLSNISTSCQILIEEIDHKDFEQKKQILLEIEEQIERAKSMTYSLLEFARKKEYNPSFISLNEIVEETVRLLKGNIPESVEIVIDVPQKIHLVADKHMIQQALLNIIKNGIDAIHGAGSVFIKTEENIEDKTIEIKIRDTGAGIDAKDMQMIFEPFFTTKEVGKGSGLGLFVAREIVEEHGGTIEAASTLSNGTTFSIKLPVREL